MSSRLPGGTRWLRWMLNSECFQPRSMFARSGGRRPSWSRKVMTRARKSSSSGARPASGITRKSPLAEDRVEVDPDLWAQVVGFTERREVFRADYQTFTGQISGYELHPLHLLVYHGNWYVLAFNPAKDRVETFALSRFRRLEGSGKTFQRPVGFDPLS